jgi:hypothetical protein
VTQQQIAAQPGALGADGNLNVYVVPGSVIATPVSASVIFDGTSAAGAFIPCLTFKTQTGAVIARCPAPEVAAGDTAEVSWFPSVGSVAAAAPTSTTVAYAQGYSDFVDGDAPQTVTAGGTAVGTHAHVTTTDSSILFFDTATTPNDRLRMLAHGTYLVWSTALWERTDVNLTSQIMNSNVQGFRHNSFLPDGAPGFFVPTDGLANSQDYAVFHVTGAGASATVLHQNATGIDRGVEAQFLTAVFLGTG